jgi:hypothetical protein
MVNEDIARGMVCFFHQKKHSYLILVRRRQSGSTGRLKLVFAPSNLFCSISKNEMRFFPAKKWKI